MNFRLKFSFFLLIPYLLFALVWDAEAFNYNHCHGKKRRWDNAPVSLRLLPISFPQGGIWAQSFEKSVWRWNSVTGSWISFNTSQHSNNSYSHIDGHNQVYWRNLNDDDVLAYTYWIELCYWNFGWNYEILEADIAFNTQFNWSTNQSPSPGVYPFEPVAMHELGHALGLNHEVRRLATMNPSYPNGGGLGHHEVWRLHGDDMQGARFLYPEAGSYRDLTTSRFKRTNNSTGGLSGPSHCNFPNFPCKAGDLVLYDFTFENLGTQTEIFNVGFYLSKDRHITKSDIYLGASAYWAGAGFSGTFSKAVNLPSFLPTGNYYLGYILDINQAVPEVEEAVNFGFNYLPFLFTPTNYYRNNFMALPYSIRVQDNLNVPNQYHLTSEVTWADIKVDAFGWVPTEMYLLKGSAAGSSPLPVAGCGPAVDIANPTVEVISPQGATTIIPPASNSPVMQFSSNQLAFYLLPYSQAPQYVQVLAKAPNGCFVKSQRRNYRYSFDQ
jgi:hypothetical protein